MDASSSENWDTETDANQKTTNGHYSITESIGVTCNNVSSQPVWILKCFDALKGVLTFEKLENL